MTIQDMHVRIEQELFHVDGLFPERIDQILNDQINSFVRSKIPAKRNAYQEGIDDSIISAADLDTLKVFYADLSPGNHTLTYYEFSIPENCLYPISFDAFSHYSISHKPATQDHPENVFSGRLIDITSASESRNNQVQKSDYRSPMGVLVGGKLNILKDKSFILKGANLTYIKKPAVVDLSSPTNCDLPLSVHAIIVDRAIAYILENSESERLKTKAAFNQRNE
jgi:hypothetical protein